MNEELFDFNVDDLVLEVEMEKIRNEGTEVNVDVCISDSADTPGNCDIQVTESDTNNSENGADFMSYDSDDNDNTMDDNVDNDNNDEEVEYVVSAINLTLQRTTKLVNGAPVSVKRSMSLGYTENINLNGATPKRLFDMMQEEFKNFAQFYHDNDDKQ